MGDVFAGASPVCLLTSCALIAMMFRLWVIWDFRNGDPALLVGDKGTEGLLLMLVLGDVLGSTLWSPTRLALCSVLLTLSADFSSVEDKNFSFLGLYSGPAKSPATSASSQTQLRLEHNHSSNFSNLSCNFFFFCTLFSFWSLPKVILWLLLWISKNSSWMLFFL